MDASAPPALDPARLYGDRAWRYLVLEAVGSTNAEAADRFRAGEPTGLVVVTEHQTAGRGRLGRVWETPAAVALTASFLTAIDAAPARLPWLPLATGLAVADAVQQAAGVQVGLKWPNDVLVGDRKLVGVLVERIERARNEGADAAAVIGIGVNVAQSREQLPPDDADRRSTSLALEDADVDRTTLLLALAAGLTDRLGQWREDPVSLAGDYRARSTTVGTDVRVHLPDGRTLVGRATDVAADGRLVVRTDRGEERLHAGDVVHVRPHLG